MHSTEVFFLFQDKLCDIKVLDAEPVLHAKLPFSFVRVMLLDVDVLVWLVSGKLSHKLYFVILVQFVKLDICKAFCKNAISTPKPILKLPLEYPIHPGFFSSEYFSASPVGLIILKFALIRQLTLLSIF